MIESQLKKGTTPFLVLALLEHEQRHGYELSRLIELRSGGVVRMHAASLYPLLYQLERQKWITGRWVEQSGQRRRRYYRLTPAGRRRLEQQRNSWVTFVRAIGRIAEVNYA